VLNVTAGAAVLLVQSVAVADVGWQCGRRLYPTQPLAAVTAAVVLSTAGVILVLEMLGIGGLLQPVPVLAATTALWLAARLTVARGESESAALPILALRPRRSPRALIAFCAAAALAALLLAALIDAIFEARPEFDALWYHLPIPVQWLQAGNIRIVPFVAPSLPVGTYPANGELLDLWFLLPVHKDFLVQLASIPAVALSATGVALLARTLGARPHAAAASALLVLTLPPVLLTQVGTNLTDLFMAGAITASAAFLARFTRGEQMRDGVLAGMAAGLAVGARYQALIAVLPLVAIGISSLIARRQSAARLLRIGVAATAVLVSFGGYWYIRNWLTTGDPLYPEPVRLPFHTFSGARSLVCCNAPSWMQLGWQPGVWAHRVGALLFTHPHQPQLLRSWGPMLAVLLLAGLTAPVASAWRRGERSMVRWAWALYPAAQMLCYLATPNSAGYNGSFTLINARFMLATLMASAAVLAAETTSWRPVPRQRLIATALLVGCGSTAVFGRDISRRPGVVVPLALALVILALVWLWRGRRLRLPKRLRASWAIAAAGTVVLVAAPVAAHYGRTRTTLAYADVAAHLGARDRLAVVGVCRMYALYGPDLRRRVSYLTGDHGLDPPLATSRQRWLADLRHHRITTVFTLDPPDLCFAPGVRLPQAAWITRRPDQFQIIYKGTTAWGATESLWRFDGCPESTARSASGPDTTRNHASPTRMPGGHAITCDSRAPPPPQ
jgi:Dolichyl-phosphate-mannose-protein mannosyltransferase